MKTGFLRIFLATLFLTSAAAQLKDMKIGSRPLTDVDMEKYVDITKQVTPVSRGLRGDTSPTAVQKVQKATAKACEPHGWGTLDYGAVNARVTAALTLIKFEKQMPTPADKKADVELVRKWKDKIDAAKKQQ